MKFSEKTVFISGASRGIGAKIASSFRDQGAYVIGTRRSVDSSASIECDEWFYADFSNENEILKCAEFLKSKDIDILVNNAGININANFAKIDLNNFKVIQTVNVLTPFLLSQAVLEKMQTKKWGRIVNISSIWGKISMKGRAAYSASKFALDGLTIGLAAECSSSGIMANCVSPGFVDTDLTRRMLSSDQIEELISKVPIGRLGKVNEISELVLWLSSPENTFVTGQNISIDGGFTRV